MRTFGFPEFLYILEAARWTLALSAIAFIGGSLLGIAIALCRVADGRLPRVASAGFIRIFQGTPLLLQLFLVFFGLPLLGVDVSPLLAAGVALTRYAAAFLAEIWRGCVDAVPRGQWEASSALGLNFLLQMQYVILPQAFKIALAPTVGYFVQVIKGTSLAAIIGFTEVTRAGQIINNATFEPLKVFSTVAAIYFLICWPLSLLAAWMERRRARVLAH
jgi:polar amino acid transport system permease protein